MRLILAAASTSLLVLAAACGANGETGFREPANQAVGDPAVVLDHQDVRRNALR